MNIADLERYEQILSAATNGDEIAIDVLRRFVANSADKAPDADLIEIADFILGFLRRHVADAIERN